MFIFCVSNDNDTMTPTKHYLLQIPPQEVAHLADGESGGPRVLVQEGVELVRLVLQGLGVGDLHGHPGDDAEAITESLVDNLCVDLERKIFIGKKILFQKMTLLVPLPSISKPWLSSHSKTKQQTLIKTAGSSSFSKKTAIKTCSQRA